MNRFKRTAALFLALVICLTILPRHADTEVFPSEWFYPGWVETAPQEEASQPEGFVYTFGEEKSVRLSELLERFDLTDKPVQALHVSVEDDQAVTLQSEGHGHDFDWLITAETWFDQTTLMLRTGNQQWEIILRNPEPIQPGTEIEGPHGTFAALSPVPAGTILTVGEYEPSEEILAQTEVIMDPKSGLVWMDVSLEADGEKVEAGAAVTLKTDIPLPALPEMEGLSGAAILREVRLFHVRKDETLEELPVDVTVTDNAITALSFTTESFSGFAVIYTVDFHYILDGEPREISFSGGGAVSFLELMNELGLYRTAGYETAEDFATEVSEVAFSDPALVWVGKTDENTTVGALREANGLETVYSEELTEEDIQAINEMAVQAGDWALISLLPFDTEERLTVSMKDGDTFTVRVTDAQITTYVLTADGATYEITVTYGDDAKFPEGVRLSAEEITEEEKYLEYVSATAETLGRDIEGAYARFFDISIMDAEGNEIQPAAEVKVQIQLLDKDVEENMEVVHFGESAELMDVSRDEDSLRFDTKNFSVFAVITIETEEGSYVFHGDGFTVTITHTAEAQIPLGTILTVEEIDPESDEFIQRLGQAWYEVNREYFEVEEMRANYNEGMGDLPDLHLVNLDAVRFFDISLDYNGEKIEPNNAVRVEISYDEGLKALGNSKPVSGVAHFSEEKVELFEDVKTVTDEKGGIVSFKYEQSSFSDTGTFVGRETYDAQTPQYTAPGPKYNPEKAITLSSLGVKNLLGTGEGAKAGSSEDLPAPASSKTLTPNKTNGHEDGTYTLKLSVAGSSKSTSTAEVNRSNILIVMDRSSSMWNNNVKIYTAYNGSPSGNTTYYGKEEGTYIQLFTHNGNYYKTRQGNNQWNYTYTDQYTGQVYTATEGQRRLDEEQAALSTLISQLLAKNNQFKQDSQGYLLDDNDVRVLDEDGQPIKVNDIIEISVISFADRALGDYPRSDNVGPAPTYGTEVGWTTSYNTLMAGVNKDNAPSGTNWEDALRYAKYIADTKHTAESDEPMFVLFLTDGEPTAYAGEIGGAHHYGSTAAFDVAYEPARDDARVLVTSGYEFYGIFTYGEGADQVGYLKRLVNFAYGHADSTAQTSDLTEHFHDAGDNDALLSAFEHILSRISGTIAVGNVTIADGLTTDATASTVVSGSANGFRYSVTGPVGELYSVIASGSEANPTVTFTINGNNVPGVKKTAQVTRNQVDSSGTPIPDPDNPGKYLTVTEDKTYYSATVGDTEYKMALASIESNGQITWDLSAVGTLMGGYTYNCSFVVWPDQDAYDYVADLNNGKAEWNQSAATAVLDENGNVVYYKGGVSKYPSIVKYPPEGPFSVLTNTNQSLTYSIVDTKTDETTGETETTYDGPYTKPLDHPDPMDLTGSSLSITKDWDDSMDKTQLTDLVNDYAAQHGGELYSVTLTMYENGERYKDHTFSPVWDEENNCYTWASESFSIAPALLVSRHPGGEKTYKTVTLDGVRYYVLNDGHEYTLEEEAVDYHFEFSADSYHPALVDGELFNVAFVVDDDGHIVSGSTATLRGDTLETFTGTNTLKGRLYVKKEIDVPKGVNVDLENTTFNVKITLTDSENVPVSSPQNETGTYDSESGLMYRIHYGPNNPDHREYDETYHNYGRSDKMPVINGVITEAIYYGDEIYVGNIPVGTHYEVEEPSVPRDWKQTGIVARNENYVTGEVDTEQIIYGNRADYVTITNTALKTTTLPIPVTKILKGRDMEAGEFAFVLKPIDIQGNTPSDPLQTIYNPAGPENDEATFNFTLNYNTEDALNAPYHDEAGNAVFFYVVYEEQGDAENVIYSDQQYIVKVTLIQNGNDFTRTANYYRYNGGGSLPAEATENIIPEPTGVTAKELRLSA